MTLLKKLPLITLLCSLLVPHAIAAPKLPPVKMEGMAVEDLATPYNLQASVVGKNTGLTWDWDAPDPSPMFLNFGYEVFRDSAVIAIVPKTAFTDYGVAVGAHTYKVRVRGGAKDMGKKVSHHSAWSEPAQTSIVQTCGGPPVIQLNVIPTRKVYNAIPSLRLHFTGDVQVPVGCRLDRVMYHIDSGMSAERAGPLMTDSKGRFDEFIDAMGPEDEMISGAASFKITVTAKDEAGGATSGVFAIDLEKEDPYAPKKKEEQ